MKLKIKLYSFWATGTGKAGGSLDSIVLKDKDNLPYIPGKTLKGLLRDAYAEIGGKNEETLFGHSKAGVNDYLKKSDLATGILRFNSAKVLENRSEIIQYSNFLYHTKTAISLDGNGQAEHQSVRKNEMTIPIALEVDLYYKNIIPEEKDNLKYTEEIIKACKMLRLLGEKRYRGLGRCKIEVEDNSLLQKQNKNSISSETTFDKSKNSNTLVFNCKLNDPIILILKDKTEHNIESLDYIPGSVFRGIVAGKLFSNKSYEQFINSIVFDNSVQFEDAHILSTSKRTYKLPFSYYAKNSETDTFINFHHIKDWSEKTKQKKEGYFTENGNQIEWLKIQYGSVIKSSRSIEKRASEEGGLFTYHYLEAGQKFQFSVKSDKKNLLEEIYTILTQQKHFIGKSATTEFGGSVDITFEEQKSVEIQTEEKATIIYAESNLCFLNEFGEFTATPTGEQLTGNATAKIDWLKSQIKARHYAPYNGFRKNWDAERLIIEKGSVFVLEESEEPIKIDNSKKGLFQTEGYGNILINPSFLMQENYTYKSITNEIEDTQYENSRNKDNSTIAKYLKEKNEAFEERKTIKNLITTKYNSFSQNKNSQWARVYNATTEATDLEELLLTQKRDGKDVSILRGGISNSWSSNDIKTFEGIFEEENCNIIQLIRRIAKNNIKKDEKNEVSI